MLRKILYAIAVTALILLPVAGSIVLSNFSPYFNNNSWGKYFAGWLAYTIVAAAAGWILAVKTLPRPLFYGGFALYLVGTALVAVGGLGAAPDFGPTMLQHPEREHLRYFFLLLAAILFAAGVIVILTHEWQIFPKWNRWIALLVALALTEIFWEFIHQYLTYEHLKSWVEGGHKADDFQVHYFNATVLNIGAFGRICQYLLIAWLALILMQRKRMRKWAFAVICFFCALGLTSAIGIIITAMHLPKNMEILMIFFIPAAPLLLLYWEGVALLTTKSASQQNKK